MEDKIKEVQDYFVNVVLKGNYRLLSSCENVAMIIIDEKYAFSIWISGGAESCKLMKAFCDNFMDISWPASYNKAVAVELFPKVKVFRENAINLKIKTLQDELENIK